MHGLKYNKNKNRSDIISKASECFSEIGFPYEEAEIDRVHRIGKSYKNESLGLTVKPIISKFNSWRYRQLVLSESIQKIFKWQKEIR